MRKFFVLLLTGIVIIGVMSCQKEKSHTLNNIIVPPHEESRPDTVIHMMNEVVGNDTAKWVGSIYNVHVRRYTSDSLSYIVDNTGKRYRNNIIQVKVTRKDGTTFFDKKFTKAVFERFIDKEYMDKNVLLGLVYNGADNNYLHFLGSVGAPDILTEEFIPFDVSVSRMGEVSVEKATLTTHNDSTIVEDDGV